MITVILVSVLAVSISSTFIWKKMQSQAHRLTLENLKRVRDMLESSRLMDDGLRTCFQVFLQKFPEEPPWVTKNAHAILIGNGGEKYEFVAGRREWMITVCAGGTLYQVTAPSVELHEVRLCFQQPLSAENLDRMRNLLERYELMDESLRTCFSVAIQKFHKEPPWVRKNAQMILKGDDGKELQFATGKREWKISVFAGDCKYHVTAPSACMYLARLHFQPQPLSIQTLKEVRDGLEMWRVLTSTMRSCFMLALQEFSKEPNCIKTNAQMIISIDEEGENLEFLSGNGDVKIYVTSSNGDPQYQVMDMTSDTFLERLCHIPVLVNVRNLSKLQKTLATAGLLYGNLNLCFQHMMQELPKYPKLLCKRPQMYITWDESGLVFVSPQGDCEVSVQCHDGTTKYTVSVNSLELNTWELFWERIRQQTHPLSIEKLEEMRTKLRSLKGTPNYLLEKFSKAIHMFHAELKWLQNNARLVIECDEGEVVFLSGKGENIIDICCIDKVTCYFVKPTLKIRAAQATLKILRKVPELLFAVLPGFAKLFIPSA
ncbi:uncharacterized protein LOC121920788 [Sceloporus undulatus]|uniref:uncharacterized protein LOC121920788 n=1 Tax=Sceloporus undulatus TaxID=8520 RepID=UPI001C4C47C0|nr:uncharacterized protein LOC121920788 [Sceloporus undulatus]XP_042303911.1 uncharacterized protein LOC121920788 [Sceloporus undulatus]XP_042303912.1 uncharacterized protein LOC121920788 [Sceloporus undulatus]XP_042303913.1 uncharacterized protein LOC121920788 [Sceloporus undulatus]